MKLVEAWLAGVGRLLFLLLLVSVGVPDAVTNPKPPFLPFTDRMSNLFSTGSNLTFGPLLRAVSLLTTVTLVSGLFSIAAVRAEVFSPRAAAIDVNAHRISDILRCGCRGGGLGLVILLLPSDNIATTASAYPMFHWYNPTLGENRVEFSLYETDLTTDTWHPVFMSTLRVSGEPGISQITLPSDVGIPPLEVGKTYYWSIEFTCDVDECTTDLAADGWLQRVAIEPDLAAQLAQASPSEQVTLAAQNGLWLEASNTLIQMLQADPTNPDLQARWQALLHSVGLEMLINQPFVDQATMW